jgi:hypothetical protein
LFGFSEGAPPVGCRRVHSHRFSHEFPEDPPILPIDSDIEPGLCAGIKNDNDEWNLAGHADRIVWIDEGALAVFAAIYDDPGTPVLEARLSAPYTKQVVKVLERFALWPTRMAHFAGEYKGTEMWHQTNAPNAKIITETTRFIDRVSDLTYSGPHIHVGNPFFKTPRAICREKGDYDPVDLTSLPGDYLPRTNFLPGAPEIYRGKIPNVPFGEQRPVTEFYRWLTRSNLSQDAARTLLSAIVPPGPGHIDACFGVAFSDERTLVFMASVAASLPMDFFIKTTANPRFRANLANCFPVIEIPAAITRTLLLNCITDHYASLWRQLFDPLFRWDSWAKSDPRLSSDRFRSLTSDWQWSTPLRTDYERRQALVEIDVLVAMGLGLTLERALHHLPHPVSRPAPE